MPQRKLREPRRPSLDPSGRVPAHQLGQIQVPGGVVQLLDFGAWDASIGYVPGNVVTDGTQWLCIAANTNQEPPNDTYWQAYDPGGFALAPDQLWHPVSDPVWADISSGVTVTRVSGGDSNPDISVVIARAITVGQLIGGLTVIQLLLKIGAGGAGSGTSPFVINGLGNGFATDNYMAGTGMFFHAGAGNPLYRCSMRSEAGTNFSITWDGAAINKQLGPASSSGGGPFNFAAGDVLFDGQVIVPTL